MKQIQESETRILSPDSEGLSCAREEILHGGVVGIPTETVYGLAANAWDAAAVEKIFQAKGRPADNPLIVHISEFSEIYEVAAEVTQTAKKLGKAFWPGPLTMILKKSGRIPSIVSAGLDTVGIRMPSHPVARKLIKSCGVPLAAPSANVSGKPSPTTAEHVYHDLKGKIRYILDGGESSVGLESTVVLVLEDGVKILRPGGITVEDFLQVVSTVTVDDGVFSRLDDGAKAASPGMKYKHYSPAANVIMVEGSLEEFQTYVAAHQTDQTGVLVFAGEEGGFSLPCFTFGEEKDSASQANRLFDVLREIDQSDLDTVYARVPSKKGVGMAVYNRLLRACGFQVQKAGGFTLGLTGQTGSGKSTVCDFLVKQGAALIDCDLLARGVIKRPEVIQALCLAFGEEILSNGEIDRKKLAGKAFADRSNLEKLNGIMNPPILSEIQAEKQRLLRAGKEHILLDAPTLFESGAEQFCDAVVSVIAPESVRMERILQRDNLSEKAAAARMSAQMDDAFYIDRSQYVIENQGSIEDLCREAERVAASCWGESR